MKIIITKENLLSAIQKVQHIVSPKVTLPILSNLLIETGEGIVKFNTTDLDIGISCKVEATIKESGAITIPAKRFSDIVRELPNGDVSISVKKNNQIDIEGVNCRFKLIGLPKEEFPKFPEFKDKDIIDIKQVHLKEMLRMTSFAVSHEESRYVLNGVLMEMEENTIRFVATDGRRLAKSEYPIEKNITEKIQVILPNKAVSEINRNLNDENGIVSFVPGQNQVLFDIEGTLIATRIIEGDFPNYKQVVPKESNIKVGIQTDDLLAAIRRANLLATPDFQAIKFEVFKEKMVISKSTPDVGESREEVDIDYNGSEMVIGFNPQYLIDVLKNIHDESIELELTGPDKPCVIRLKNYLYLALPMRI